MTCGNNEGRLLILCVFSDSLWRLFLLHEVSRGGEGGEWLSKSVLDREVVQLEVSANVPAT